MNRGKIFIVDDEAGIRLTFRLALETDGYKVEEAASATGAMKGLGAEKYDLVILDLRLGGDDGLDILAKMRQRGIRTPVLMVTAHGSIRQAVRAIQLGAIDFLEKSMDPENLRRMVSEVFDRHQPRSVGTKKPTATGTLIREAKRFMKLQDFDSASIRLAAALHINGAEPEIHHMQGVIAEICGDYAEARRAYGRVIRLDSQHEGAQQNLRRLSAGRGSGRGKEPIHYGGTVL